MNIDGIWSELEALAPPGAVGRFKRRIHPESKLDVFIGVAKPSNERLLMLLASDASLEQIGALPSSQGVEARIVRPGDDGRDAALELALIDPRFADVFTVLVSDLVESIALFGDEGLAVADFVTRLRRWQRFLEESGLQGISTERQRGLYAELWVMRELLAAIAPTILVGAWTGPESSTHDFEFGSSALEVKATASKQHQFLRISSELQLDDIGLDGLFLGHVSLDVHRHGGESLPQIVDDLACRLGQTAVLDVFESKLMLAGYLDRQRALYEDAGYTVREYNVFRVASGFPRIVESGLPPGVGDVHYSIVVSECKHFLCAPSALLKTIAGI